MTSIYAGVFREHSNSGDIPLGKINKAHKRHSGPMRQNDSLTESGSFCVAAAAEEDRNQRNARGCRGQIGRRLAAILAIYKEQLSVRPRCTNAVVSMVISYLADLVAQHMEAGRAGSRWAGYDFRRSMALVLTSAAYNGFILTTWLMEMDRRLPRTDFKSIFGKLALTQGVMQPFVYVPFFFVFHGILLGQSMWEIYTELSGGYVDILFRLWSLFMPTRLLMFMLIPVRFQVLWDMSISFVWQIALSLFDAQHRPPALEGIVSAMLETQKFGHLHPRAPGVSYLPHDSYVT